MKDYEVAALLRGFAKRAPVELARDMEAKAQAIVHPCAIPAECQTFINGGIVVRGRRVPTVVRLSRLRAA